MAGRLAGKRIVVTAAARGIGRACVIACAREGAAVLAIDIDDAMLADLAGLPGVRFRVGDLTDPEEIKGIGEIAGRTDALLSLAGYVANGSILTCDEDDWQRSLDLNVTSMYRLLRAFLPGMIAQGGASIVTMSSVASSVRGVPNRFAYGATKAAVIGLTKALAADHVSEGIRANAICPGTVQTPSLEDRLHATGDYTTAREAFIARQPMHRLGAPEEIAALAVFLASDESSFTTGQVHVIDGGWSN